MKSVLFAAASTLLASVSATHEVVTKDSLFGGEIVTHSFNGHEEANDYIGDNLSNTKVTKWGEESIFGEKRKCILVAPGDMCTYKITIGPKTGKMYWLPTSYEGNCNNVNDYHLGSTKNDRLDHPTKHYSEMMFDWIFGLVDDDESGTVDKGEVPDHVLDALDTNNDNKVDASEFDFSAEVVFGLFDEDGSGKISVNELPEYLIDIIEKSDDNNDNNDREITLEEFTTMFNKQMHPKEEL